MITRRILWALCILCIAVAVPALLFAQAQGKKLPQFYIGADVMDLDFNKTPRTLVYDGNVRCTSKLYDTVITCKHLEGNASSTDKITSVEASGKVVIKLTVEIKAGGKDAAEKTPARLEGTGELITYSIVDNNRVLRMVRVKDVRPRLTITDLATKELLNDASGDEITYNLDANKLHVHQVDMGNEGDSQ
jgi:lipopolysaccharide export system protein LptA